MQKILFLFSLALLAISISQAQIKQEVNKSTIKKSSLTPGPAPAPTPAPPPPPAPVNKTTGTESANAPVYSLTSVRVKIKTGNDNKEFPSKVFTVLARRNRPSNEANAFNQMKLDNEMKINSESEFGMERVSAQYLSEARLEPLQAAGLKFSIHYYPNFFADAWKIESITLILEFKDQFGNLHPNLGNKTVVFSNAYGLLNGTYWNMECETDGSFAPLTAIIKK